jgi:uncharacterized protein
MAKEMKVPVQVRLKHAKESLEDAKTLVGQDVGANFILNSVYYAFLFAFFGLLESRGKPAPNQNEVVSLFEREYVSTGQIEARYLDGFRTAFDLRPSCDCEEKKEVKVEDIEHLIPIADEFLKLVERLAS